ncbi:MAG: helix-turn-helix domain-containing protein [Clostridiales bacterium]|nr:helix-turn-helix domain-containing protein [Clostridiales bacterium]
MNERIKILRKSLGLTQQNFAYRIGMKQNSIALIESGRNTSDQTILSICREFNVNEEWLRNGKGKMFNQSNNTLLQEISAEYNLDDFQTKMVEKFLKLDETRRKVISDYIRSLIDTEENQTDKQEKIIYDEPKLVKMPARGGVYEVMETEEQKKAFKEDLKFKYEYDPNDF